MKTFHYGLVGLFSVHALPEKELSVDDLRTIVESSKMQKTS